MVDLSTRTRKQGLDEQQAQLDAHLTDLTHTRQERQENQKHIDEINRNKIAYHAQQEQMQTEQQLYDPKVGLPEMERREALQQELQANPHQNQVFKGVKAGERFRMGQAAQEQATAEKKHHFKMAPVDANRRILEAGNNPTPKKENELNDRLARQEKILKGILKNPNVPFEKKVAVFRELTRRLKLRNNTLRLPEAKQTERGKELLKKTTTSQQRETLKRRSKQKPLNLAMQKIERCA